MEAYQRAVLALLKFADQPHEAVALARHFLKDSLTESQYRALLAAVGGFARDNESYFLRYDSSSVFNSEELASQFEEWVGKIENGDQSLQWLIFRKPNEPRMRAAYEVLAGWVLKFLYQTKKVIPIDYADGQARIWSEITLSSEDLLWRDFISWFPDEPLMANMSTILDVMGSRIGTLSLPSELASKMGTALVKMAIEHPRRFQNNISFNGGRGLADLADIITLEDLSQDDKILARVLQNSQRVKMDVITDAQGRQKSKGGDLYKAISCVRRVLLSKIVVDALRAEPKEETQLYDILSQYKLKKTDAKQLIDDLKSLGIVRQEDRKLEHINGQQVNWLGLAYVQSINASTLPPFAFSPTLLSTHIEECCLACGSPNVMHKAGTKMILPESKKVWYDRPKTKDPGNLCVECFFAALISGFYPSEAYSVCELPVISAYQTFLLAQQLSNITASLGAMAISRSALLTVLPSRYFLVRLVTGRGALPRETQLYLLLADYSPSFPSGEEAIRAYLEAAGPINYLCIRLDLLRILNLFRRGDVLPFYSERKDGNAKARGNDAIRLLKAGRPYSALYRLLYDPFQDAQKKMRWFGERDIFKSSNTLATFDRAVQRGAKTLLGLLLKGGGEKMLIKDPEQFYKDVKDLSDVLYDLLEPIAQADVNESKSKVSVVVRKYVDAVEKRFPQLDLVELQYMVAKAGDDAEKRRVQGKTVYIKGKDGLRDALNSVDYKVAEMYERYFRNGNAYLWREFIKEVSQRLLAKLLLGVRAAQPQQVASTPEK